MEQSGPATLMEEMNRFEAEIATSDKPQPPRQIIGSKTFSTVQKKLEDAKPLFPPPPPIFPGNVSHSSVAFSGIPPPPPPPAFLIPHQVKSRSSYYDGRPGPAVLAAAPTKYSVDKAVTTRIDEKVTEFLSEIQKDEEELERQKKSLAKLMADRVRASTIISFQSQTYEERRRKSKKLIRMAGGQSWEDPSLSEWEEDDFRIFCGDLGNDVTDDVLTRAFNKYPSFLKAKVVRDKRTNKTKGFGFISFKDPQDFIKAMKEMNGRYVGSRPIKLRKSTWRHRSMDVVKKKDKEKAALINILTGRAK